QRDFDLADALDDPEPTKKPNSVIYPTLKPRPQPQPGNSGNSGGGGGDGYSGYDSSGNTHERVSCRLNSLYGNTDGGDYHVGHDSLEGNMVAKIVSPIVSVVVVTLLGAAASYFKLNNRRNCFRTHEPENV
uniref:Glycoprotein Xg n=1 Tax=Cebus imitator TaxID=2715852 RepID=A0A2K5PKI2_CEBIM